MSSAKSTTGVRAWLQERYQRWLARRLPMTAALTLNHSQIVILPTRQGLLLLLVALAVLLLAINFESALNYALAFWLIAMIWVAVYMTYRNLSGLTLRALDGTLVPVDDLAEVHIEFSSKTSAYRGSLELIHSEWGVVHVHMADTKTVATIPLRAYNRGPVRPPRFRLESRFPFGLIVAWTHILIDAKAWAYPQPRQLPRKGLLVNHDDDEAELNDHFLAPGSEDFHSIRAYQPGDSIKRLHWPGFSRDQLMIKTFSDYQASDEWLDWQQFEGSPDELRLAAMAYYSQLFFSQDKPFGLRLPGQELLPEKGLQHLTRVRRMLAEYGYEY